MKRLLPLVTLCLVLLAGFALAQQVPGVKTQEPPPGWPNVMWALLGILMPWVYNAFFSKLPGWLRFVVTWGITFGLVAVVDLVLLHWSLGQFLASIGIVISVMQSVYQLWTKQAAKARTLTP